MAGILDCANNRKQGERHESSAGNEDFDLIKVLGSCTDHRRKEARPESSPGVPRISPQKRPTSPTFSSEKPDGDLAMERNGKLPLIKFDSGETYKGEWLSGKLHGRGIYTWPHGGRYEGNYRHGKKHGLGIQTWASGNRYEGEYSEGRMHGRGAFTCVQGGSTYSGVQPSCTSGIEGGSTYSGNFEQDRPTNGELVEADGTRFKVTYAHDCSFVWKNPKPKTKEGPPGGRRQTHSPVKTKGSRPPHRSDPCPEPLSSWHPVPPKQWVKKDGVWLENGEQEAQGHKGEQEAQGHKTMPVTKPLSPGAVRAQSTLSFLVEYRGEE